MAQDDAHALCFRRKWEVGEDFVTLNVAGRVCDLDEMLVSLGQVHAHGCCEFYKSDFVRRGSLVLNLRTIGFCKSWSYIVAEGKGSDGIADQKILIAHHRLALTTE